MDKHSSVWCYVIYGRNTLAYYDAMFENITLAIKVHAHVVICTLIEDEDFLKVYFNEFISDITILSFDKDIECSYPKFLRYMVPLYLSSDYYFFKDSDSLVTDCEIKYMTEWMENQAGDCLILRDHPLHVAPILGGMFGFKNELAKNVALMLVSMFESGVVKYRDPYLYDQLWLAKIIYPLVRSTARVYSSHFYYFNENVIHTINEWDSSDYIGRQFFTETDMKLLKYNSYYQSGPLAVPFYPNISFIYQKARPLIWCASLLSLFKRLFR